MVTTFDTKLVPFGAEQTFKVDFWLNPQVIKKMMGIRKALDRHADWQILKVFSFGEVAYDYEEGLKIKAPLSKLDEVFEFVKKLAEDNNLPKTMDFRGTQVGTISFASWNDEVKAELAKKSGLLPDEFGFRLA
jgi:hypothetical protein